MICVSKMWLVRNFHKIKVLALTSFIYLASPLLLLCILILHLYRGIICVSAKVRRKDLYEMISPSTSVYASDELYGIPNRNTVCFLFLKGRLALESLQTSIDKKILSVKNAKGAYKYPHLRMFPSKFQKFLFWKMEEEFKVGNHVMMYEKARDNNRVWTEETIHEMQRNLIRKQWKRLASPWEIILIPNYRTQSCGTHTVLTVLCVRFHVCIGNEVSWMKLLTQTLCDGRGRGEVVGFYESDLPSSPLASAKTSSFPPATFIATLPPTFSSSTASQCSLGISSPPPTAKCTTAQKSRTMIDIFGSYKSIPMHPPFRGTQRKFRFICGRFLQKLLIPFRIPFDFAEQIMEPLSPNEWHVAETSLLKRDHVLTLDRFSVQHVKEIKNMLGVSFSSVLMAALSSALRLTFVEAGLKVPSHMKVMLPVSCSSSSQKKGENVSRTGSSSTGRTHEKEECDNEATDGSFCWINLPLGISSSRERLRCCETALRELRQSTRPISNRVLFSLIGLLPFKYHWYFLRQRPWTGVLMNLKGPSDVLSICDHQIEDVIVSSASDSGFVLSFVSYADYLRISLVCDRILPNLNETMARNLLKNIYAELVLLAIDGAAV